MRALAPVALLLLATVASADEKRREKLGRGEILLESVAQAGTDVPKIILTAVIDAPPAEVWPIIDQCGEYKNVFPRIAESEELERSGNKVRCRTLLDSPWPVKDLETYAISELTVEPGKRYVRKWTLEKGDFDRNDGSWTLTPFNAEGTRTLAVYEIASKPHTSVPGFIRKAAQKSALPDVMEGLRDAVKKRRGK